MKHRYVTEKDAVYWIEDEYDSRVGKLVPVVKSGYYLSSYKTTTLVPENHTVIKNIVSYGSITSCVVRHINDGNTYSSYLDAMDAATELRRKSE